MEGALLRAEAALGSVRSGQWNGRHAQVLTGELRTRAARNPVEVSVGVWMPIDLVEGRPIGADAPLSPLWARSAERSAIVTPGLDARFRLVHLGEVRRSYEGASESRRALRGLLDLADEPRESRVVSFLERFGPPLEIKPWLLLNAAMPRTVAGAGPSDFVEWAAANGDVASAVYLAALAGDASAELSFDDDLYPVALVRWIAARTKQLADELEDGEAEIGPATRAWVQGNLGLVHPAYYGKAGHLGLTAESLLAYLTVQLMLGVGLERIEARICPGSGTAGCKGEFMATRSDQRYCTAECRERVKHRRRRAGRRSGTTAIRREGEV